jgi:hypothetical protein
MNTRGHEDARKTSPSPPQPTGVMGPRPPPG